MIILSAILNSNIQHSTHIGNRNTFVHQCLNLIFDLIRIHQAPFEFQWHFIFYIVHQMIISEINNAQPISNMPIWFIFEIILPSVIFGIICRASVTIWTIIVVFIRIPFATALPTKFMFTHIACLKSNLTSISSFDRKTRQQRRQRKTNNHSPSDCGYQHFQYVQYIEDSFLH